MKHTPRLGAAAKRKGEAITDRRIYHQAGTFSTDKSLLIYHTDAPPIFLISVSM
jgi:hypothetical protein